MSAREYNRRIKQVTDEVNASNLARVLAEAPTLALNGNNCSAIIYFVKGARTGLIKIGYATDFPARLKRLQSHSPDRLHLLWCYRSYASHERDLHNQFAEWRAHGEWFRPSPPLLAYIKAREPRHFLDGIAR